MKKSSIFILAIFSLSFGVACYFYPLMPERMASHWGAGGGVNGYMSKFWGLFLMPLLSVAIFLMLRLIPKIDPLKANVEKFRKYFDVFIVLILVFFFYIYLLTISWNLGYRFNMVQLMAPAMGLLFYYCGILVSKAKRNYFIGIRTPWTLSSDVVWDKTHRLGGRLFRMAGAATLLAAIFPDIAVFLIITPIICVVVISFVYSYSVYRQEAKTLK